VVVASKSGPVETGPTIVVAMALHRKFLASLATPFASSATTVSKIAAGE